MSAKTAELSGIISKFGADYQKTTPMKLKLIDAYLGYCFFTGVIQVCTFIKTENTIVFNISTLYHIFAVRVLLFGWNFPIQRLFGWIHFVRHLVWYVCHLVSVGYHWPAYFELANHNTNLNIT